jgi:hypothetical protein
LELLRSTLLFLRLLVDQDAKGRFTEFRHRNKVPTLWR